jgi:hypothetical protein
MLNDHNAKAAGVAMTAYVEFLNLSENVDFESLVNSLVCDLIHLCDRNDVLMADVLYNAQQIYAQEIEEDDDGIS